MYFGKRCFPRQKFYSRFVARVFLIIVQDAGGGDVASSPLYRTSVVTKTALPAGDKITGIKVLASNLAVQAWMQGKHPRDRRGLNIGMNFAR